MRCGPWKIANIPGDTDSRRAYYDALEQCNLSGGKEEFYRFIAGQVRAMAERLVGILGAGEH